LAAFSYPAFRRVFGGSLFMSLAEFVERLGVGWLVLVETDSVFLTAATFAARSAPGMLMAPFAGASADRFNRSRLLAAVLVYRAATAAGIAGYAAFGPGAVWPIFVLIGLAGVGQSFQAPALQGLVTDSVKRSDRMNAVSLQSTGTRLLGAIGGVSVGIVGNLFGVPIALAVAAGAFFAAGLVFASFAAPKVVQRTASAGPLGREAIEGFKFLWRDSAVRTVLLMGIMVEIFGFAFGSIMPAVARNVLGVGLGGLGALQLMAGFGGVLGVAGLAFLGDFPRKGLLIVSITLVYGVFIATFSASGNFPVALVLLVGVGAMAASFDAMQWILLQHIVPEDMRGRAIGGWVLVIGMGWVGHLAIGAVAEWIGVQQALGLAGAAVVVTGLLAVSASRRLRTV